MKLTQKLAQRLSPKLVRATVASLVATGLDYLVFHGLAHAGLEAGWAAVVGSVCGGVTNFELNRHWAMPSARKFWAASSRYAVASGSSALLQGLLVSTLQRTQLLSLPLVWALSRFLCFVCVTYPLFSRWVFAETADLGPAEQAGPARLRRAWARPTSVFRSKDRFRSLDSNTNR